MNWDERLYDNDGEEFFVVRHNGQPVRSIGEEHYWVYSIKYSEALGRYGGWCMRVLPDGRFSSAACALSGKTYPEWVLTNGGIKK